MRNDSKIVYFVVTITTPKAHIHPIPHRHIRAHGMAANKITFHPSIPEIGFIRQSTLIPILGFSGTTLWRRVKQGTFPKPIKLSANVTAWRAEDVRAWIEAQGSTQSAA